MLLFLEDWDSKIFQDSPHLQIYTDTLFQSQKLTNRFCLISNPNWYIDVFVSLFLELKKLKHINKFEVPYQIEDTEHNLKKKTTVELLK